MKPNQQNNSGTRRSPGELFSSVIFYLAILIFIIGFNFSDTPLSGGWYQQFMPPINNRPISDITFLDSLTGFVVTPYTANDTAYILKTTNGGDNWNIVFKGSTNVINGFNRIQFINQSTGFCASGAGIFKTTNAGINWTLITNQVYARDMYVLNNDTIWTVDDESLTGGVFRTTDGGASWEQQLFLGSANPDHIYMYNGRIGFISETNNYIRKTTNSGVNWDTIVNGQSFRDMYFIDSLKGWRAYGNNMYLTSNGGNNWITQLLPDGGMIVTTGVFEFSNVNADTIWAVGGWLQYPNFQVRGMIYRTTNGGNNWGFQLPDTSINIFQYIHCKFINGLNGWANASTTEVHTVTGGGDTTYMSVNSTSSKVLNDFKLYSNYPNPFNPGTNIKYQIVKSARVTLKVFDIQGREIAVLVSQKQNTGTYEVTFDGTNYSSGVYFYSLYADGNLIDTKRMVLLK